MFVTPGSEGLRSSGTARGGVFGRVLVLALRAAACWPLPTRLVPEELARKNHPEGEQSDKCPGRGNGKHAGRPPTLWFRKYCTKLLRLVFANVKKMLRWRKKNSTPRRSGCVERSDPVWDCPLKSGADDTYLLLAEEDPGKNDPEGEESSESSSGGDC